MGIIRYLKNGHRRTHRRTLQLRDWIGLVDRFSEISWYLHNHNVKTKMKQFQIEGGGLVQGVTKLLGHVIPRWAQTKMMANVVTNFFIHIKNGQTINFGWISSEAHPLIRLGKIISIYLKKIVIHLYNFFLLIIYFFSFCSI